MSYYINIFLENFDWILFKLNDAVGRSLVKFATRQFFQAEWRPKRAIVGGSLDEAVQIKIDADNNPDSEVEAGRMHLSIRPRIANVVGQLVIDIGPQGITDNASQ